MSIVDSNFTNNYVLSSNNHKADTYVQGGAIVNDAGQMIIKAVNDDVRFINNSSISIKFNHL